MKFCSQTSDLQQEVSKLNNICVSSRFPKTDLVTNLLNLENQIFEIVIEIESEKLKFFSIATVN